MSLIEQIKKDQVQARIARDAEKASLLTTLIGEAEMIGKNAGNRQSTDAEVITVVKKFINNMRETLSYAVKIDVETGNRIVREIAVLDQYLPTQMTEDQIKAILESMVATLPDRSPRQMGVLMKQLKEHHEGLYDGALASKIAKTLLG